MENMIFIIQQINNYLKNKQTKTQYTSKKTTKKKMSYES